MRANSSAVDCPSYDLPKRLTKDFEKLPDIQNSISVKDSLDFIINLKNVSFEDGEILVIFDI